MQYPQRKAQGLGSDPGASCCEAHVSAHCSTGVFTAVNSNNLSPPYTTTMTLEIYHLAKDSEVEYLICIPMYIICI